MTPRHQNLSETHIVGEGTRQKILRANELDHRSWLAGSLVCPALDRHQIVHLGVCEAQAPYEIVRMKLSGTYFLACVEGEGRILVDGRWQVCKKGMACLLPPHLLHAFHAIQKCSWRFAWVRYQAGSIQRSLDSASSPVLSKFNGVALEHAILGMIEECGNSAETAALDHWLELIQHYVLQFAQPEKKDERLNRVWQTVNQSLDEEWDVDKMCTIAHVSGEHLRRLCLQELGRSPMRQVTYMRMRRAAELLSSTDDKIETIARIVGYQNAFVFSTTFKKWIGWRPSEHRIRGKQ